MDINLKDLENKINLILDPRLSSIETELHFQQSSLKELKKILYNLNLLEKQKILNQKTMSARSSIKGRIDKNDNENKEPKQRRSLRKSNEVKKNVIIEKLSISSNPFEEAELEKYGAEGYVSKSEVKITDLDA